MITSVTSYMDYSLSWQRQSAEVMQTAGGQAAALSVRTDTLEIRYRMVHAQSVCGDLMDHITDLYELFPRKGTQEGLRSFYALAAGAIEKGFGNIGKDFSGEPSQLANLRNQAMKELKDWYHNGGKPREKVSFASLTVAASQIEACICSRVEKAFSLPPREQTLPEKP